MKKLLFAVCLVVGVSSAGFAGTTVASSCLEGDEGCDVPPAPPAPIVRPIVKRNWMDDYLKDQVPLHSKAASVAGSFRPFMLSKISKRDLLTLLEGIAEKSSNSTPGLSVSVNTSGLEGFNRLRKFKVVGYSNFAGNAVVNFKVWNLRECAYVYHSAIFTVSRDTQH